MKRKFILLWILIFGSSAANAFSFASVVEIFQSMQREMSAWAVTTKQSAVAANQVSEMSKASNQQLATAIGAISMSERIRDAVSGFSGAIGQPESNRCQAQRDNNAFTRAMTAQRKDLVARMNVYVNSRADSIVTEAQEKIAAHDDFCSVSEAKQGICKLKPNGMQSWDSNYSSFYSQQSLTPTSEIAALNYVNMTTSNTPLVSSDCKSVECKNVRQKQNELSAISSMATNAYLHQVSMRVRPEVIEK